MVSVALMSLMLVFMILPFKSSKAFNLLIMMEVLVLILFMYMFSLSADSFFSVFFLCVAAAESSVGLSSLIALVRATGNTSMEL